MIVPNVTSMESIIVKVSAVFFIATFVRSAFGFGEALIAVPLLSLLLPVDVAVPVAVLVSIMIAAVVVVQDWRQIHLRIASRLFFYSLFGIPIGLFLLIAVPEIIVKSILAIVIIAFSAYSLMSRKQLTLKEGRLAWVFGFFSGVLGGAYGMNGPPLVIYGTLLGWSPQQFRATLQGYFLPASIVGMMGYAATGLWTNEVTHFFLLALPSVLVAIFLGRMVNQRMKGSAFIRYVHIGLIIVGIFLFT